MKKSKNLRISQCMIVKNEEKNIEKALSWGKGIVAEQIVVDTGSTDRTVEIAKAMGAQVYYFQWIDDFAAAKNFAIEKARYEWIALLDADEYFTEEDARKLPAAVWRAQENRCDGIATGWIQLDDQGRITSADTQIRVFRNGPTVRYKRRIHEYLSADNHPPVVDVRVNDLSIFHTGYTVENYKKKREIFSQVEKLKSLRLDVPQVTLLAYELQQRGIALPDGILTTEELADALCRLAGGKGRIS